MKTKPKRNWCYLNEAEQAILDRLSESTKIPPSTVLTVLASSALKACAELGDRLPLPLTLKVAADTPPSDRFQPQTPRKVRL